MGKAQMTMSSRTDHALLKLSNQRTSMQCGFWKIGYERFQYSGIGLQEKMATCHVSSSKVPELKQTYDLGGDVVRSHEEHNDVYSNLVTSLRCHAQVETQDADLDGAESSSCDGHKSIHNLDYGDKVIVACVCG